MTPSDRLGSALDMTDQSKHDAAEREMEREEHLDAETIFEDAEELFERQAPEGSGELLQPDNPPPEPDDR